MKKTLNVIVNVLIWLFVAFSALVLVLVLSAQGSSNGVPTILGKSIITVQSDSMKVEDSADSFQKGDLLVIKALTTPEEQQACKEGDIITFFSDINNDGTDELNTHRIISVSEENGTVEYVTQGDNDYYSRDHADLPIKSALVVGLYKSAEFSGTKLAGIGGAVDYLQTKTGFFVVIVIPMILFFIYELYELLRVITTAKRKKMSAEEEEEIKKKAVEEYLRQQAEAQPAPAVPETPTAEAGPEQPKEEKIASSEEIEPK